MLRVDDLGKTLGTFRLEHVTFDLQQGDYFVLLGESGAGKTVILELIAGLQQPDQGTILLDGEDITRKAIQKRGMGLVYQDHALFPHLSVRRNIAYSSRAKAHSVDALAADVGATALLDRAPSTLSLGEAQRVALARALATSPHILLLDEPLASLDRQSKAGMRALLRKLNAAGQTIIHVTHDFEEAIALASKVAVLENSHIAQVGTPDAIFHHPTSDFVAGFVGIRNFFRGQAYPLTETTAEFRINDLTFIVATDSEFVHGNLLLRSEDITVSPTKPEGSARNVFKGTIVDIESVRLGIELTLDIGIPLFAMVTRPPDGVQPYQPGMEVWASFKATAARFIPDEVPLC